MKNIKLVLSELWERMDTFYNNYLKDVVGVIMMLIGGICALIIFIAVVILYGGVVINHVRNAEVVINADTVIGYGVVTKVVEVQNSTIVEIGGIHYDTKGVSYDEGDSVYVKKRAGRKYYADKLSN